MTSRSLFLVAATAVSALAVSATHAQRAATERHVYVEVTDKAGKTVAGLSESDFTVREDGATREILKVSPAAPPTHIALLLDDSQAIRQEVAEVRRGAGAFVDALMTADNPPAISLVTFGGRSTSRTGFTTSVALIDREITRLFPQTGTGSYSLDAIFEACQAFHKANASRPVIVVFSADASPEFSDEDHTRIADALKVAQASLWSLVLEDRQANLSSQAARERAAVLDDVTPSSGGRTTRILSRLGIEPAFTDAAAALTTRYDVTYSRPDTLVPPSKLNVMVKVPDAKVLAPVWTSK
jgi:VWFA-related protein